MNLKAWHEEPIGNQHGRFERHRIPIHARIHAHRQLDDAVCAAYASSGGGKWTTDMPEAQILEQILTLNLARPGGH